MNLIRDDIDLGKKHSNALDSRMNISMLSLASSTSNDSGIVDEPDKLQQIQQSLTELNEKISSIFEIVQEDHQIQKMVLKTCSDLDKRVQHLEEIIKTNTKTDPFDPVAELLGASLSSNCNISNQDTI